MRSPFPTSAGSGKFIKKLSHRSFGLGAPRRNGRVGVRYQIEKSPDRLKVEISFSPFRCCPCHRFLFEAYVLQQKM